MPQIEPVPETPYDPAALLALFPDVQIVRQLATLAISDLRRHLAALRAAAGGGDVNAAARSAHSLAGIAADARADALRNAGREAEALIRRCQSVPDMSTFAVLEAEATRVIDAIERWMAAACNDPS
jgi:HPt (histidine-containing phosphotransfer) domain-containing protein